MTYTPTSVPYGLDSLKALGDESGNKIMVAAIPEVFRIHLIPSAMESFEYTFMISQDFPFEILAVWTNLRFPEGDEESASVVLQLTRDNTTSIFHYIVSPWEKGSSAFNVPRNVVLPEDNAQLYCSSSQSIGELVLECRPIASLPNISVQASSE